MNRRHRPVLEELEPRILFSADVAALTGAHLLDAAEVRPINQPSTPSLPDSAEISLTQAERREIVFVDTSVDHWETLVGDIETAAGKRNLDVVLIDASRDGVDQISAALANRTGIDAIHIISHGSAGMLQLGNTLLDATTLAARSAEIQGWQNPLVSGADILLYGCDVAGTAAGQAFVTQLGQLTGADIAASSDQTGNAAAGGNWVFEYKSGSIEALGVAGIAEPTQWSGTLAITSNGTATSAQTTGATSLTWSHTVNAGTDRVLVVELAIDGLGAAAQSVTYGGAALTQIGRGTGNHAVELWALINPNVGTANVAVSFGGATTAAAGGATTFDGVAQTMGTAFGTFVSATGTGLSASVTAASAVGDKVIDVQYWKDAPLGGGAGAGQTIQWWQSSAKMIGGSTIEDGAPSVVMSGNMNWITQWEIAAVSMRAAVNNAPLANGDSFTNYANTTITGNVLANDTDADGNTLSAHLISGTTHGSLVLNGDGSFSYTPTAGWSGTDGFQYLATDGVSGLTHYWALEGTGTDAIGVANGTLTNGPATTSGKLGQALSFDGVDDYVALPDISYTNDFSLAFYFKVANNTGNASQYFYSHGPSATLGQSNTVQVALVENAYSVLAQQNTIMTTIWDSNDTSGQIFVDVAGLIGDGQWHLYTATVTAGVGTKVFIDGTERGSVNTGGGPIDPVGSAYLGARSDLDPTRFLMAGGGIDGLGIYNRALGSSEVASLAANAPQASVTLSVTPLNTPPINTVPGAQSTNEDTTRIFSTVNGNALSMTDADAGGANNQVTLSVTHGTLTLSGIGGLSFVSGDGTGDATMTFRGTAGAINAALNGLSYSPSANYHGSDTLTLSSKDSVLLSLDIDNSLAGRYTFDNSGNLGSDSSPSANNTAATVGATSVVDGTRGPVVSLDGSSNSNLQVASLFGTPSSVTLAAWVKLTAADTGGAEVISLGDDVLLRLDSGGSTLLGGYYNGSIWVGTSYSATLAGTGWHHVAYSFDDNANTTALYLDGIQVSQGSTTDSISYTNGLSTYIGSHGNGQTTFDFNGLIDDARIYTRALTPDEVATLAADTTMIPTSTVTITVTAVNDAPSGTDKTQTILEDASHTFTIADFGFTDPNDSPANALQAVTITTLPTAGSLTLSGLAVSAGQSISAANISAGNLVFTPVANANGAAYASFTFQVQDNGGTSNGGVDLDPTPNTFSFDVTAVNDAPVLGFVSGSATYTENAGAVLLAPSATLSDVDSPDFSGGILTVYFTANGQAEDRFAIRNQGTGAGQIGVSGSNVTYGGVTIGTWSGGVGAASPLLINLNANASISAVTALARNVTYQNVSDTPSTAIRSISGYVTDGDGGTSNIGSGTLSIAPVNDAPTSSPVALTAIAEDSGSRLITQAQLLVNASDIEGDTLTASNLAISSGSGTLVDNGNGTWSYTPAANDDTAVNFSYTITDNGTSNGSADPKSAAATASLDITPVNDPPAGAPVTLASLAEDNSRLITQAALLTGASDVDGDALSAINLALTSGSGTLTDNGDGTWTFAPTANWSGNVSFSFAISDGTTTTSNTASLTVTPVNDAPVLNSGIALPGINEDDTSNTGFPVSLLANLGNDVDSGALHGIAVVAVDNANGTWQYTLDGTNWSDIGTVSQSNALLLAGDATSRIRFLPNSNWNGITGLFTFKAWDETSGTAGSMADASINGGSTAFSIGTSGTALNVTAVNDPPAFTSTPNTAGTQGVAYSYTISATDPDTGAVLAITAPTLPAWLTLTDNGDGTATLAGTPGNAQVGAHAVVLQVSDGTLSASQSFNIIVANVNDAPAITSNGGLATAAISVPESQTAVTVVTATDPDVGAVLAYTLAGGADAALFSIDPSSGALVFNFGQNFELTADANGDGVYEVTVQVSDGSLTDTQAISITLTNVNEAPSSLTLSNSSISENTDTTAGYVVGNLSSTDPDTPDSASYSIVGGADAALFSVNGSQQLVLTAGLLNFEAKASYNVTLRVSDAGGLSYDRALSIAVQNLNEAPSFTSTPNTAGTQDIAYSYTISSTDPDTGAVLAITAPTLPAWLTLTDNGDGTATLAGTPGNAQVGTHAVVLQVSDGSLTASQSFNIVVANVNDAPTVTPIALGSIQEDASRLITQADLLAGANDVDGDTLTAVNLALTSGSGSLTDNGNGTWTFTPTANWNGNTAFSFAVSDGTTTTANTAALTVAAVNDPPAFTSTPGTAGTQGVAYSYTISTTDPDTGAVLAITAPTLPAWLTLTDNGDGTATLAGTPGNAQVGAHAVVLQVSDGTLTASQSFNITVANVNDAPAITSNGGLATAAISVPENQTAVTIVTATDPDVGAVLAYTLAGGADAALFSIDPNSGALVFNFGQNFELTADANGDGVYEVTVQVSDGSLTDTQAISITVTNVNEAPTAVPDGFSGNEDTPITGNVLSNDSDPDGDTLTAVLVSGPSHGTLGLNTDGSFTYTAAANWYGSDSFSYQSSDGSLNSSPTTVTLTVAPVNDAPTVTPITLGSILEDGSRLITQADLLAGANDVDGDTLTAVNLALTAGSGNLTDNANGTWTFAPAANWNGSAAFSFAVSDGTTATVNAAALTVTSVNDAPTSTPVTLAPIAEDSGPRLITQAELLANATDIEGDALTASNLLITSGSGSLVDNGDGTWTYTPAANDDSAVSFSYTITDNGTSGGLPAAQGITATASLDITPVNDAPVAANGTLSIAEDTVASGQLPTATDVDGDQISYTLAGQATHGSVTVNADGSFSYQPAQDFNGNDSFNFTIDDAHGASQTYRMDIVVTPINDAPVAMDFAASTTVNTRLDGNLPTASDVDGDPVQYALIGNAAHGVVNVTASGQFAYLPGNNYNGPDHFSYTVSDGQGGSNVYTATLNVTVAGAGIIIPPTPSTPPTPGGTDNSSSENSSSPSAGSGKGSSAGGGGNSPSSVGNSNTGNSAAPRKTAINLPGATIGSTSIMRADDVAAPSASNKMASVVEHFAMLAGSNIQRISFDATSPDTWSTDVSGLNYLWKPVIRALGTSTRAADGGIEFQPGSARNDANEMQWLLDVSPAKAAGVTLSVGVVWWTLRAGGLLASLAASLPVWRGIDVTMILDDRNPLPIKTDTTDKDTGHAA